MSRFTRFGTGMRITKSSAVRQGDKKFSGALVPRLPGPSGLPFDHAMEEEMNTFPSACHVDVCDRLERRSPEQMAVGHLLGLCNMA